MKIISERKTGLGWTVDVLIDDEMQTIVFSKQPSTEDRDKVITKHKQLRKEKIDTAKRIEEEKNNPTFERDAAQTAYDLQTAYQRSRALLARWKNGTETSQKWDKATIKLMKRISKLVADDDLDGSDDLDTIVRKSDITKSRLHQLER